MWTGGEGGIRTHDTLARIPVFETGPFNRSGTSPEARILADSQPQKAVASGSWYVISTHRLDRLQASHVRLKGSGNLHAAARSLIVFHDRDQRAADGQTGTVQGVHELGLALLVAKTRLHAARLERLEIAARRDLAIGLLRRQPHLDVVGFRRGENLRHRGEIGRAHV